MVRAICLVLAVCGSVLVIALVLFGHDLQKAARTGPDWKRRLVAAGLALLGAIGMTSGCGQGPGTNAGTTVSSTELEATAGQCLEETKPWIHLTAVWHEAEEIGSGKRGDYPFDDRGRTRILGELATVASNLDKMQDAAFLTPVETELLKKELVRLTAGVEAKRSTEMRNAMCYSPMPFVPCQESLSRLTDRLPLLKQLAESKKLHRAALDKVLGSIEADIEVLSGEANLKQMQPKDRDQAQSLRKDAEATVAEIKRILKEPQ